MPPHTSEDTAPSARKRLKPDERRSQILEVAVAFFAEVGLEGRTRDLSERAGITQSLLYNYFGSKEALIEAVFERVYLDRLQPDWRALLTNRTIPLSERMQRFYEAYTRVIFTYEWMRIFMFAGLAGSELNQRYLAHVRTSFLEPMLAEIGVGAAPEVRAPDMEDVWALHGAIVYIGIRRYVYQVPTPEPDAPYIARAIAGFLRGFGIDP